MGLLDRAGARLTARPEEADILVVNTCSFIDTAKQESVDTILEMARHKTEGRATKLIVAGCLVERYRDEIRKNIPEVDAVVGTGELESILEAAGIAPAPVAPPSLFNILGGNGHGDMRAGQESLAGSHKSESTASRPEGRSPRAARPLPPRRLARRRASAADVSLRRDDAAPALDRARHRLTSRSPRGATIPAPSASSPTCAANSARGVSSRWLRRRNSSWPAAYGKSR